MTGLILAIRMIVRRIGLPALAVAILLASGGAAKAQDSFNGTFEGLDEANGLSVQLRQIGREVTGRISAPDGSGQKIEGQNRDGTITSELIFRGQRGTARIIEKGVGLSIVWAPANGSGGDVVFAFRRQQLDLPGLPTGYTPQPPPGARDIDPSTFLRSYEFWEPNIVAGVYDSIEERYRALIRIFPLVHADLIWKLCQSTAQPRELGQALRGEGVTCAQVDTRMKAAQRTGAFNAFKQRMHVQKADALLAVECARGIHNADICQEAAVRTQRAAVSLETVTTVLQGI